MQDAHFAGSIPQLYERLLVPLIFEPYAIDLARRAAELEPARVLEIAAGTGVLTRQLAAALPSSTAIVASDLNEPMLSHAASIGTNRPVEWRQADAMQLPFDDESFDLVICQFGAMFFPDKAAAFGEARRVLRGGGCFLFSVWDRIETNEFADVVTQSLEPLFSDPPRFLARTPHGYHDVAKIADDVRCGGFTGDPGIVTLAERSRAPGAELPALAYCHGTPLRNEIGEARLDEATRVTADAIAEKFGRGEVDGKIQAHVVRAFKE